MPTLSENYGNLSWEGQSRFRCAIGSLHLLTPRQQGTHRGCPSGVRGTSLKARGLSKEITSVHLLTASAPSPAPDQEFGSAELPTCLLQIGTPAHSLSRQ